ncbi:DUF6894 family protein [Neoaquamicrobium sediminum]|uniref:DUF6894 family protein n=1 Tax=Neoaquamicrobium sediminum TaxID=1849104 RepID=UPI0035E4485E
MDGHAIVDTEGLELENDTVARTEALRGAAEMMANRGMTLWLGNTWVTTVVDEHAKVLRYRCPFARVLR